MTGLIEEEISRVVTFSTADAPVLTSCLSVNTILTLITSGVGVAVGVREGAAVAVAEGAVGVLEDKILGVFEAGTVTVAVLEGVLVGVLLAVKVAVMAGVLVVVGVREDVTVAVEVGVKVVVDVPVTVGEASVTVDVTRDCVCEETEEIAAVAVFIKGGVSPDTGVCVDAGDACRVWAFNKGIEGGPGFENREKPASKIPEKIKTPRIEKAICARTLFCRRMM